MSGGGSGGGGSQSYTPVNPNNFRLQPVPQTELQTQGYGGMGYTQVPQTYTPQAAPSWMQGGTMDLAGQGFQGMPGMDQYGMGGKASPNWYQMPQWGKDAVTGEALTQEQLQPQAYEPPPAEEVPAEEEQAQAQMAAGNPLFFGHGTGQMYKNRSSAFNAEVHNRSRPDPGMEGRSIMMRSAGPPKITRIDQAMSPFAQSLQDWKKRRNA